MRNYVKAWTRFNCKHLGDYSDLHLLTDILLLLSVYLNLFGHYYLDKGYYLTVPNLNFDAMLTYIKVESELLND